MHLLIIIYYYIIYSNTSYVRDRGHITSYELVVCIRARISSMYECVMYDLVEVVPSFGIRDSENHGTIHPTGMAILPFQP